MAEQPAGDPKPADNPQPARPVPPAEDHATRRKVLLYTSLTLGTALLTVAVLMLLINIGQRKEEARVHAFRVVEVDETTIDPAQWGKNYPRQYDSYKRTADIARTRWGGSEAFQRLDEYPVWRELFAGYPFAIDFREDRGHYYMLTDQRETERVTMFDQPGACLHCHASVLGAYRDMGIKHGAPGDAKLPLDHPDAQKQLHKGFELINAMPYEKATLLVEHPVSCVDCHDPRDNALRVTRPAFQNAIQVLAESDDPLPHLPSIERWREGNRKDPYDANLHANRQEMRSLVCAQCHVEYYFHGDEKMLTYPWHNGLKAEHMEKYYDDIGFKDWTHATSKAPMLKAQHPEFEMWSQGIHARSGVSCADCHMPYEREGAIKVSSHHVRSPLLNINNACQTCHRHDEQELLDRVHRIQNTTRALMDRAEKAVHSLIKAIDAAQQRGVSEEILNAARHAHRQSQWRLDFVFAENSLGFHASQETARLLGEAIDYASRGEIRLHMQQALQKPSDDATAMR